MLCVVFLCVDVVCVFECDVCLSEDIFIVGVFLYCVVVLCCVVVLM